MRSIKNIGILAHVDAGKTTITEQLLCQSGAIPAAGRVDHGSTVTDSMPLERERGITIRTGSASLIWNKCKINLIDTPGHMDFIAEVKRVFGVLEGAVLVISAKEGVQSQTKLIFRSLQRLHVPTLLFINKIDRTGADVVDVYRQIKTLLTPDIVVMQDVKGGLIDRPLAHDEIQERLLECDIVLQEQFLNDMPIDSARLFAALRQNVRVCSLYPVLHGAALQGIGITQLLDTIEQLLPNFLGDVDAPFCGSVFKVERDESLVRRNYVKVLSGCLRLRQDVPIVSGQITNLKVKALQAIESGRVIDATSIPCGDIAILPYTAQIKIGDVLGEPASVKLPVQINQQAVLKVSVLPTQPQQRPQLLRALAELSEEDPALAFTLENDEIAINILGNTQREIVQSLLARRYGLEASLGELRTIYQERPKKEAETVVHIEVPPNPYWASIGLRVEPLPLGSGLQFESEVSVGYLNPSFQNAVHDGVKSACTRGLYGWALTDAKIVFSYGLYYSAVSTPSDFRHLTPHVMEKLLRKAGTELLEPYCGYTLEVPETYAGKALNDLQTMGAEIEGTDTKEHFVVITGRVSEKASRDYSLQVVSYTGGQGVFTAEFSGYSVYKGEPVSAEQEPDDDKLRHQFLKAELMKS